MTYEELIEIYFQTAKSIQDTINNLGFLNPYKLLVTEIVPNILRTEIEISEGESQILAHSDLKEEYQLSNIFLAWSNLNKTIKGATKVFSESELEKFDLVRDMIYEYFLEANAAVLIKKITELSTSSEAIAHLNHILAPTPAANKAMLHIIKEVLTVRVFAKVKSIVALKEKGAEISRLLANPSEILPISLETKTTLQTKYSTELFSIDAAIATRLAKTAPAPAANPSPVAS